MYEKLWCEWGWGGGWGASCVNELHKEFEDNYAIWHANIKARVWLNMEYRELWAVEALR